jgi:uncharacterized phage protein (TIGR02218 family)
MRALDPSFLAHLQSGATTLATCWRIARADGWVFRLTDHDRPLLVDGELYEPDAGGEGARLAASNDLSVDNTEFIGLLSSDHLRPEDLLSGRFDGAEVEIWRVNWDNPDQRLLLRRGIIGEIKAEGQRFTAEVRGLSHRLDETRGRVYGRACDAVAGDRRCGVDLDAPAYRAEGVVVEVVDEARVKVSDLSAFADQWFALGRLDWTSGANAGTGAHVKSQVGAGIALFAPAPGPIAVGDAFVLRAGCDKAFATCVGKFANAVNFRGFHLMPGNDAVIQIPQRGGRNDGGRR